MKINDLPATLEEGFEFPVDQSSVLNLAGWWVVEAPDGSDSETIGDILGPIGEETYDCAELLFEEILCNLSDDYIGRKFYDDRGSNISETNIPTPHDENDQSF